MGATNPTGRYDGAPARRAAEVTPSDSEELAIYAAFFYVGGEGDVKLKTLDDDVVTLVGVPAGSWVYVTAKKIFETGTTATDLVAFA